ncbi:MULTISPECIES: ABC transporter ATP-binding protein [unclassified Chelatococcus]|uniref:dipeptide ABC transporter ATP-binding protein n=1 Tax=unclassified Chelatococcus TaxID=2638111 RepID=UPI001BCED9BD|nr:MULTISPECIES: ABC transporter ATP-binding protein [unclassified Chelatococcus]CAH1652449.1 Glutathione import ATP-binding protein GsiA [Hyphomicrobiales bacterium]MBS7743032.1 ABC transporter ATP-binding protein [Chelatococcus sp. HY11]MBX3541850.1 ABC transporter ATP-binding protein [Chelatococcus sp.]MCO5074259.1 ABC transporter ATP-binding protein [Chelatococcus sp.]CAH1693854.1 Glutathione import ATP-binding protein GsiA [Hyphomicrobiales bacterium]
MTADNDKAPLLEVSNLTLVYRGTSCSTPIVRDVSFTLKRGEVLGVIGESGAGKSSIGNSVIGLLAPGIEQTNGAIRLHGAALEAIDGKERRALRGRAIASIFQDPSSSLDPLMTVGAQLDETISALSPSLSRPEVRKRAIQLLERVGIPDASRRYHSYPHQLSGGQRQRIVIATALAGSPSLIVADEPTSALDATVQKQILQVLKGLVAENGLSILLITHDMGVIAEIADRVVVMKDGEVIEQGATVSLLKSPRDPYTRKLLAAVPKLRTTPVAAATKDAIVREPILVVENLSKTFGGGSILDVFGAERPRFALRDIGFRLSRAGVLGIVGESGSGKSTIGRILAGLETGEADSIQLDGKAYDISHRGRGGSLLGRVQMIFQDPASALNPRLTVAQALTECVRATAQAGYDTSHAQVRARVVETIERLGLQPIHLDRYPHQLSGGQKQRVCIARALLAQPKIVIADEPTSALDVSVQAEILSLLKETVSENRLSMIFISHDLAVVQDICDEVCVMRNGKIEDYGSSDFIFGQSENPYTRHLIEARPKIFAQ